MAVLQHPSVGYCLIRLRTLPLPLGRTRGSADVGLFRLVDPLWTIWVLRMHPHRDADDRLATYGRSTSHDCFSVIRVYKEHKIRLDLFQNLVTRILPFGIFEGGEGVALGLNGCGCDELPLRLWGF